MNCDSGEGGGGDGSDRGATSAAVISVAVICSVLSLGLLAYGCYYFKRHPTARDLHNSTELVCQFPPSSLMFAQMEKMEIGPVNLWHSGSLTVQVLLEWMGMGK